jgi:uncharacterized protein YaeQ
MAIKATIFKADLQIADMERGYYADHALTIARHPSETDERMMVRLLAFALNAADDLVFARGLSAEDEPDLWAKDLTGEIQTWIEVGLPDEKIVRRACGRSRLVKVFCYGGHGAQLWWKSVAEKFTRQDNLEVTDLPQEATRAMAKLAQRTMRLQYTIQEGEVWVTDGAESVQVQPLVLKRVIGRGA